MLKISKIDFFVCILSLVFYIYCVYMFKYFTAFSNFDIFAKSFLINCGVGYYFYLYLKNELAFKSFFVFIISSFVLVNILFYINVIL